PLFFEKLPCACCSGLSAQVVFALNASGKLSLRSKSLTRVFVGRLYGSVRPPASLLTSGQDTAASSHAELDLDRGLHCRRLALEGEWPVTPLLHGANGRLNQNRMPGYRSEVMNASGLSDCGLQNDVARDAIGLGLGRINRVNLVHDHAFHDSLRDA